MLRASKHSVFELWWSQAKCHFLSFISFFLPSRNMSPKYKQLNATKTSPEMWHVGGAKTGSACRVLTAVLVWLAFSTPRFCACYIFMNSPILLFPPAHLAIVLTEKLLMTSNHRKHNSIITSSKMFCQKHFRRNVIMRFLKVLKNIIFKNIRFKNSIITSMIAMYSNVSFT